MVTHNEFEAATRRAQRREKTQSGAVKVTWDPVSRKLMILLCSGMELSFPPSLVEGFDKGEAADFSTYEISASGFGIYFPTLDADLYLPGLLAGLLGSRRWMAAQMGAYGGRSRSEAKATASRNNGAKGGRPPKLKDLARAL